MSEVLMYFSKESGLDMDGKKQERKQQYSCHYKKTHGKVKQAGRRNELSVEQRYVPNELIDGRRLNMMIIHVSRAQIKRRARVVPPFTFFHVWYKRRISLNNSQAAEVDKHSTRAFMGSWEKIAVRRFLQQRVRNDCQEG